MVTILKLKINYKTKIYIKKGVPLCSDFGNFFCMTAGFRQAQVHCLSMVTHDFLYICGCMLRVTDLSGNIPYGPSFAHEKLYAPIFACDP